MHRYFFFFLFTVLSIAFLIQPMRVDSAQPSAPAKASKQTQVATTAPTKKKAVIVQAPITAKAPAPKATAAGKTSPKKQRSEKARAVTNNVPRSGATKNVHQTQAAKPAQAANPVAVANKQHVALTPPTKARKKSLTRSVETPTFVSAPDGALSDFDKQISSRSVMVMDAQTGEAIFAKNPDNPRQPASTIKIVTAMIALKSLKNDEIVDVSSHAAGMPSSKVFLDPAKNYRANDLINAVLLASANDASVALAEKIGGSEEKFARLMTLSAKMWGARNTVCRTASGLTADGQQSTARDLANLFRYAMQQDEFARRMGEKFISTSYGKTLRNHNKALWRLDGADGGKTGYTVAARQTYVGQFTRDDQTIVVAIMGSESMWADLEKLVNYGFRKKKDGQLARLSSDHEAIRARRVN